ncbi:hypothetical protein MRB53_001858 [Persea americana]|uniref:Uncharacterized protein n=1 Tax=Persea americana TaxID=3435 RepID=A0ACC2MSX4_PERAE|nr:hypothetical protein MRB53_001858 [Persea americana]
MHPRDATGRSLTAPAQVIRLLCFSGWIPFWIEGGLVEKDFEQIGEFLRQAVSITVSIQKEHGKLLNDFNKDIENLKDAIEKFAASFEMPRFQMSGMK